MSNNLQKRIFRALAFLAAGLAIGVLGMWFQTNLQSARVIKKPSVVQQNDLQVAGVKIGGPFELVNQDGETVTDQNYAADYKLMFFGFTFCPAICPMELQKMTKILEILGKDGEKIQPIFISVDPERDTVDVMKKYVALFHPRLVGLTGTPEQIEAVKKTYRIYSSKVENPHMDGYMVDHSAYIYLMSPGNDLIAVYKTDDKAEDVAKDVRRQMAGN